MRSYPIWNRVNACIYQSSKSYGAQKRSEVHVYVGTSASNSHPFVSHATTHRKHPDGSREFRFYVDGQLVKRAIVRNGEIEFLPVETREEATA